MNRAKRSAGILSVAAIAALSAFAAPALAKSAKPKKAIGTAELSGAKATGTAVARCPKGTSVVGGGYGQTPPATFAGSTLVDIGGSYRLNKRSWAVTGIQVGGGRSLLSAYAYCLKKVKVTTAAATKPLPLTARSQATVIAACKPGLTAISGGFRKPNYDGASFTFLTDNEQDARNSWTMTGVRSTKPGLADGTLTSYAYCADKHVREVIAPGVGILAEKPSLRSIAASPICRPAPFAGGFRAPYVEVNSSDAGRGTFLVTDSRATGKTWTVAGLPLGGLNTVGTPIAFSSLGYC